MFKSRVLFAPYFYIQTKVGQAGWGGVAGFSIIITTTPL